MIHKLKTSNDKYKKAISTLRKKLKMINCLTKEKIKTKDNDNLGKYQQVHIAGRTKHNLL